MKKLMSLMAAMALLALSASPLYAQTVNCNSPNQDLQTAVAAAGDGEVVRVSGTCTEKVPVDNDGVEIIGIEENRSTLSENATIPKRLSLERLFKVEVSSALSRSIFSPCMEPDLSSRK